MITTQEVSLWRNVVENLHDSVVDKTGAGWFDGNCFNLQQGILQAYNAHAVSKQLEARFFGRSAHIVDHAVLYVRPLDAYFDADGLHSEQALISKMRQEEGVIGTIITPSADFELSSMIDSAIVNLVTDALLNVQIVT